MQARIYHLNYISKTKVSSSQGILNLFPKVFYTKSGHQLSIIIHTESKPPGLNYHKKYRHSYESKVKKQ